MLLDAGIDDWGGVSPVTADHVNPERPWPALDRLREVTEAKGFALAPRLTIYPEYVLDPDRWLDAAMRFPVLDRSDAEGLGRDDPGAVFPERRRVRDVGRRGRRGRARRATARPRGTRAPMSHPPVLVPGAAARPRGAVREVLDGVLLGQEPGVDELVTLFGARGPEVAAVAELADELRARNRRRRRHLGAQPQHQLHERLHVQVPLLRLLEGPAVAEPARHALPPDARRHRRSACARPWALGATEVCLQGGIHPDFDGDYYIDVRPGGEGGRARHPRARLHRARGHRGRASDSASRSTSTCAG